MNPDRSSRRRILQSLGVLALVLAVTHPSGAVDAIPSPPQILMTSGINEAGELLVQKYQNVTRLPAGPQDKPSGSSYRVTVPVSLKGVAFLTSEAKVLTLEEARKRIGKGSPVLVMSGGEKPAAVYRRLLAKDVLILVFPGEAPAFEKARWPVEKQPGERDDRTP